jgi:hypothetical protein
MAADWGESDVALKADPSRDKGRASLARPPTPQDGTWASGIWQAIAGPAPAPLPPPPASVLGKTAPGTSTT